MKSLWPDRPRWVQSPGRSPVFRHQLDDGDLLQIGRKPKRRVGVLQDVANAKARFELAIGDRVLVAASKALKIGRAVDPFGQTSSETVVTYTRPSSEELTMPLAVFLLELLDRDVLEMR